MKNSSRNRLAVLLFVLVFGVHYGPDLIAVHYPNPEAATKALFYIARGLEGVVLYLLIAILSGGWIVRTVWLVCLWGLVEEAQTAVCRLSKPISTVPGVELFSGLCGKDWYVAGLFAALVIGAFILDRGKSHELDG